MLDTTTSSNAWTNAIRYIVVTGDPMPHMRSPRCVLTRLGIQKPLVFRSGRGCAIGRRPPASATIGSEHPWISVHAILTSMSARQAHPTSDADLSGRSLARPNAVQRRPPSPWRKRRPPARVVRIWTSGGSNPRCRLRSAALTQLPIAADPAAGGCPHRVMSRIGWLRRGDCWWFSAYRVGVI
jgi:hypothetical protein